MLHQASAITLSFCLVVVFWWWLVVFPWCVGGDVMCCDVMWHDVMWSVAR